MLTLTPRFGQSGPLTILCLGAHPDDIEIGCGGTLLRWLGESPDMVITWVVFSGDSKRKKEARRSAALFLQGARTAKVVTKSFRDGFFPYVGAQVKTHFEKLAAEQSPDIIFTHYRDDRHQDHRVISDLTWNTFRNHLILEYEIPKYDGDLGRPNSFSVLSQSDARRKVDYLLSTFETQSGKPWFSDQTFLGLMRLRGIESRASEGYAEAFHTRKIPLGVPVRHDGP